MKRILMGLAFCLASSVAFAQWQPQEITYTSNMSGLQTTPDGSCANMDNQKWVACVSWAETSPGVTNIIEDDSLDGGVTWSGGYPITSDTGQDYNPYITYDSYHKQFIVVYSKWHNNQGGTGNDLFLIQHAYGAGWSTPVMVAGGGGHSYWEGSAYALQNGNVMVSYAVDGPESNQGVYSGFIAEKVSTNNDASFGAQVRISSTCNAEFPRAIQNQYGSLVLFYSRYVDYSPNHLPYGSNSCADFVDGNGYGQSDIHEIWSSDGGSTWIGDTIFYQNANGSSALHPSIGAEQYAPQSNCPACQWDLSYVTGTGSGTYGIYQINTTNQGVSWSAPAQYPGSMTWTTFLNVNPSITLTCTGFLLAYTDAGSNPVTYGQNQYNLRYVSSACTGT